MDDKKPEPRPPRGTDADGGYDEIAVQLVLAGHHMKLHGADRAEAIRRMVERGYGTDEMANRLKMKNGDSVGQWARRHGIQIPKSNPAHWTTEWALEHRDGENTVRWADNEFSNVVCPSEMFSA